MWWKTLHICSPCKHFAYATQKLWLWRDKVLTKPLYLRTQQACEKQTHGSHWRAESLSDANRYFGKCATYTHKCSAAQLQWYNQDYKWHGKENWTCNTVSPGILFAQSQTTLLCPWIRRAGVVGVIATLLHCYMNQELHRICWERESHLHLQRPFHASLSLGKPRDKTCSQ